MKRVLAAVLCFALLCGGMGTLWAQMTDETLSGTCGEALTWTLENGTLTISGTGKMENYRAFGVAYDLEHAPSNAPWHDNAKDVTALVVEEGVTSIGRGAFEGCVNAKTVSLPETLTSVGASAFAYCETLDKVWLPTSVVSVDRYAFYGVGRVYVKADNPAFESDAYGILYSKDRTHLIHYSTNNAQASFTIPSTVTVIDEYAFSKCQFLQHVNLPGSLQKTDFGFAHCASLESVTVMKGVKEIGTDSFFGCTNLRTVELPNGLKTIGSLAFYKTAIECLHIPSSVTSISYIGLEQGMREDEPSLPYMQKIYICSDSEMCAAKEYADRNQVRFYVCLGSHDDAVVNARNTLLQRLVYVLQDEDRAIQFFAALFQLIGARIKERIISM